MGPGRSCLLHPLFLLLCELGTLLSWRADSQVVYLFHSYGGLAKRRKKAQSDGRKALAVKCCCCCQFDQVLRLQVHVPRTVQQHGQFVPGTATKRSRNKTRANTVENGEPPSI